MNPPLGRVWCLGWLLLLLLPGLSRAADPAPPAIIGETREQITPADVHAMVALAQPLVSLRLEPVLVNVSASHRPGQAAQPERATIYFAPSEVNERFWRGYRLRCVSSAIHWLDQDPTHFRQEGGWQTLVSNGIEEYLVLPSKDKELSPWPVSDVTGYRFVDLRSKMETRRVIELTDIAFGYSMALPDGSELSMADLAVREVYTITAPKGETRGVVEFIPPPGRLKFRAPIHVSASLQEKGGWKIVSVDQYVYY